jgi:hypothetical protein
MAVSQLTVWEDQDNLKLGKSSPVAAQALKSCQGPFSIYP